MACSFGRPFYGVPILSPLPWWYLRQYLQHVPVRDNIAVCVEPEHVKTGQHILGCCSLVSQQTCSQTFRTAGQANRAATMTNVSTAIAVVATMASLATATSRLYREAKIKTFCAVGSAAATTTAKSA